ncbi:transient receptor potential cation channel subfamily V member 6-like [Spea bombifrons]|uniref:transient receptor potential cation channel subfamily V member 6-like n=1 Tax=Spea bombifrons TaxID=233779 RepID=UPI00234B4C13|nr:transient receptor potential cation channel subfamily V member 6-like [Spea bombifrons]
MDGPQRCNGENTLLFQAVQLNDSITLKTLLQRKDLDPFVRGSMGETILHTAVLNGKKEVMEVILEHVPSLVNEPMTSDMYRGETALHIAILKQDVEMVKLILKHGADVMHSKTSCTCCIPGLECLCNFGEFPLSFAACTGNEEIIKLLIEHKAPLNAQDSFGNTVFHTLVLQENKEMACHMYDLILALVPLKDSRCIEEVENDDGFTPLKLAANEGNIEMFKYLVSKQKKIYWTIGTISYNIYDLTHIDTWMTQKSVLDIIASSQKPQVRKLVDVSPIKELLNQKWNTFGYKNFLIWMVSYLVYMAIFTTVSLFRPLKPITEGPTDNITVMTQKSLSESYECKEDFLRLVGELITLFGAVIIFVSEIPLLIKLGPKKYIGNASTGGPFSLLMVAYSVLIFSAAVLRALGDEGEAIPLSLALIIGWCNSIYFARGFKMLGQFSIMIQKIIFADLLCWFCLVFIIIIGFSSAFYVMCQTLELDSDSYLKDFSLTLYAAIEMMMGLTDLPLPMDASTPLIYIIYSIYMVFVYLLLLNMLIAMMDNTYWRIAHEREELWKIQIAATILVLERHVPRFLKVRTGIPGSSLGLDDGKWYIGVEEILKENSTENIKGSTALSNQPIVCWNLIRKNISRISSTSDFTESTSL